MALPEVKELEKRVAALEAAVHALDARLGVGEPFQPAGEKPSRRTRGEKETA